MSESDRLPLPSKPNTSLPGYSAEPSVDTQPLHWLESRDIVDIEPFGQDTKLPLAEYTETQELLLRPIPLENRIAHLIPYVEPTAQWQSAFALAAELNVELYWVQRTAEKIGLIPISQTNGRSKELQVYPPMSFELLEEEHGWLRAYEQLDDELSTNQIAAFIAKTEGWVRRRAAELEVHPTLDTKGNRVVYPKDLIPQLRHLILLYPPAENDMTAEQLADQLAQPVTRVLRSLAQLAIEPHKKWSPLTGQVAQYYGPEVREELEKLIVPPAGNWLTINEISQKLGVGWHWVDARVKQSYQELGETRISTTNLEEMHYPPVVAEELERKINSYPPAGDFLTLAELSKLTGKSKGWIKTQTIFMTTEAEERMDSRHRVGLYYPPILAQELKTLASLYLPAGDRRTLEAMSVELGRSREWIKQQHPFIEADIEVRLDQEGKPRNHYSPEVFEQLQQLSESNVKREVLSSEEMIEGVNQVVPNIRVTALSLRELRKVHQNIPTYRAVMKVFGSLEAFNTQRGIV